ncbi:hypothetical protein D3C72_1538990 [compost metagenome]
MTRLRSIMASYESIFPGNWDTVFMILFTVPRTEALPSLPLLVVMRITPLAPRTPYTAVAVASFSTDTVSIELISTLLNGRSTPSTIVRGSVLFHVLRPRITIRGSSSPGIPVLAVVTTPGTLPVRAAPTLATPPALSNTFPVVCVTAPTTVSFFCVP